MDAKHVKIGETIPASRKLGRERAEELCDSASRIIIAKGKKIDDFDPQRDDRETIIEAMLGRTGNLRAPLAVVGDVVLVGFNEGSYGDVLL
ncbi:MAG: hypothetical protein KC503_40860 [Myxococcales bacterium]|nr:hypothetical protein [Myxococcales bacterium]